MIAIFQSWLLPKMRLSVVLESRYLKPNVLFLVASCKGGMEDKICSELMTEPDVVSCMPLKTVGDLCWLILMLAYTAKLFMV